MKRTRANHATGYLWTEEGDQRQAIVADVAPLIPTHRTYSFLVPPPMEQSLAVGIGEKHLFTRLFSGLETDTFLPERAAEETARRRAEARGVDMSWGPQGGRNMDGDADWRLRRSRPGGGEE